MGKPNVFAAKRPKPKLATVILKAPDCEDISLTVRKLPLLEYTTARQERAEEYIAQYITGKWIDDDGDLIDNPMSLPPVDEQAVFVTPETCRILATVEAAQVSDDPFRFDELAALASVDGYNFGLMEAFNAAIPAVPEVAKADPKGETGTA
jgi:hypothetical protein